MMKYLITERQYTLIEQDQSISRFKRNLSRINTAIEEFIDGAIVGNLPPCEYTKEEWIKKFLDGFTMEELDYWIDDPILNDAGYRNLRKYMEVAYGPKLEKVWDKNCSDLK